MPHIHTELGQHDATASAYIVRTDGDEPRVLFHMHKKIGKLLQPGGHVELNETPWQAVLHEVREETGYELSQLKVLQPHLRMKKLSNAALHPMPICNNTHSFLDIEHYHSDLSYGFVTPGLPSGIPDEGESTEFHWLSATDLRALDPAIVMSSSREIALFLFEQILGKWEAVELGEFHA